MFSRPISATPGERVERDGYAYCDLVMGDDEGELAAASHGQR
jgi:hypothetical protein